MYNKKDFLLIEKKNPQFTNTGMLHVKKSGAILGFNSYALQILNFPQDFSLLNKSVIGLCVSINAASWTEIVHELEANSPIQFNGIFRSHSGEFIEVPCMLVIELGASVIDLYLLHMTNESGYLNDALNKLQVLESFFDTALLDINIKSEKQTYLATSKLFDKTFNLPRNYAVGKSAQELFPKKFADHVSSHDNSVLAGNKVVSQIDVVPFTEQHLLVQKFPLYNKNQSKTGIGVVVVDITAIKLSEKRNIDAKNKYADYYDLSSDFLWEADNKWSIRESNASGASSICAINFMIGVNFIQELKKHAKQPAEIDDFVRSLKSDMIKTDVFELNSGLRIKLSIKAVSSENNDETSILLYRGILAVLPKRIK